MKKETLKSKIIKLKAQLDFDRSSFMSHWKDLGDFILPRRPQFNLTDGNRGDRRNQKIIDSTATIAARTQRAGMMGGITSPARPWFQLTTNDPELAEFGPVKDWLHATTRRMETVFLRSNLYKTLPVVYGDIGVFATSALFIEEDFEDVVRFYNFPIGSYWLSTSPTGTVNTFIREFRYTVKQVVEKFGMTRGEDEIDWSRISPSVKAKWESGQKEEWIDLLHAICPNEDYDPNRIESKFKRFKSVYIEASSDTDNVLREEGYNLFPVMAPRWEVSGNDAYGTDCPGMVALGDIKALQVMQKRKSQAVEKMVNPPMVAPTSLKNVKASILPSDITYVDEREGIKGFRPAHEVNINISYLTADIAEHQERINRAFYADLFLMLALSDRREMTAREVEARHEEKLLVLGPVLEQLNQDLLDPLIDNTFEIMLRQGLIPPPPEEVQGEKLKVQYVSIMAQAQKLSGIASIERFASSVTRIAAETQNPAILDKVDMDQLIDEYGSILSVPPRVIRSDEAVEQIRDARASQQQSQIQAEDAMRTASAAKSLSETDINKDSALREILARSRAGDLIDRGE